MTYNVQFVVLRCVQAQEGDGDEIYMKLNGVVVWSWERVSHKMTDRLVDDRRMIAYDFRTGKVNLRDGWLENSAYDPADFYLTNLMEPIRIELWESDRDEFLRGDDDELGYLVLSEDLARPGEQTFVFNDAGAEYELTVIVSKA